MALNDVRILLKEEYDKLHYFDYLFLPLGHRNDVFVMQIFNYFIKKTILRYFGYFSCDYLPFKDRCHAVRSTNTFQHNEKE